MNTKYPVYIISKGRWETPQTANFFKKDGLDFKMIVEPQEYDNYCKAIGKEYIIKTDFSNLGVGSYPARNFAWEHSIKNGHKRHWCFDDNIMKIRRIQNGKKIPCNSVKAIKLVEEFTDRYENLAISGFNYSMFVIPGSSDRKPFYLNTHIYSALLIKNNMPHRWRLKYNEDVDLCLQVLEKGMCTVAFNAFTIDKTSTVVKMKGGNQDELYKDNSYEKKILKARSLEEIWPQYADTKIRFGRPHHYVQWNKHFKHGLVRRTDIDWEEIKNKKHDIKLKVVKEIKTKALKEFYKKYK